MMNSRWPLEGHLGVSIYQFIKYLGHFGAIWARVVTNLSTIEVILAPLFVFWWFLWSCLSAFGLPDLGRNIILKRGQKNVVFYDFCLKLSVSIF